MNKNGAVFICGALLTIIAPFLGLGQSNRPAIVDNLKRYQQEIALDPSQTMEALPQNFKGIKYQPVYATKQNFTGKKLYPTNRYIFLRQPVAHALMEVVNAMAKQGLGLLVWDAYRPHSVSRRMWRQVPDERYVANPAKGSGHNRGIAIDLTLFDLHSGRQLDMGTGFDHFTEAAHHDYSGLTSLQKNNRALLKKAMEDHGFTSLSTEWWHYSYLGKSYPVLDLSFRQLARPAH